MACKKCSDGLWQCTPEGDPCDMTEALEPIETEKHCFRVYTKKEGGDCKMRVKADGSDPGGGWHDAGEVCMKFELFADAGTGKCFVKVTMDD